MKLHKAQEKSSTEENESEQSRTEEERITAEWAKTVPEQKRAETDTKDELNGVEQKSDWRSTEWKERERGRAADSVSSLSRCKPVNVIRVDPSPTCSSCGLMCV